jgi:hypothetical protein
LSHRCMYSICMLILNKIMLSWNVTVNALCIWDSVKVYGAVDSVAGIELYWSFSRWCGRRCKYSGMWQMLIAYFLAFWRISVPAEYPDMLNYLLHNITCQKTRILNINTVEMFFFFRHHMSLMDIVASPPGCGRSVTDFLGWDAHEAQLCCPDEMDGDIWIWSTRRGLKPKLY